MSAATSPQSILLITFTFVYRLQATASEQLSMRTVRLVVASIWALQTLYGVRPRAMPVPLDRLRFSRSSSTLPWSTTTRCSRAAAAQPPLRASSAPRCTSVRFSHSHLQIHSRERFPADKTSESLRLPVRRGRVRRLRRVRFRRQLRRPRRHARAALAHPAQRPRKRGGQSGESKELLPKTRHTRGDLKKAAGQPTYVLE